MRDQLSALIDGELEIESADHLIASAKAGGELKHCWAHYHLIGDVMRHEVNMSQGFSNRVMSALDAEPIIFAPNASNISSSIQEAGLQASIHGPSRASSLARYRAFSNNKVWSVAASVAAVMFVGVMVLQLNQTEELAPVEIAQSVPTEYLQAHQAAAPNGAAYYIQNASFNAGFVEPK
jgi:sigma-E factor negative regulatory protein RseA